MKSDVEKPKRNPDTRHTTDKGYIVRDWEKQV